MNRKIALIFALLLIVIVGYLRDYIFVSINHQIESGEEVNKLLTYKWVLTFLFSVLHLLLSWLIIAIVFYVPSESFFVKSQQVVVRRYCKIAGVCYIALTSFAFLITMIGYVSSKTSSVYPFVREIMGVVQSPIIIMILMPVFVFYNKNSNA